MATTATQASYTVKDLGTLNGAASYAYAINNLGKIVGYSTIGNSVSRAVLWEKGSIKDLNSLIPSNSGWELNKARSINDKGQIVGSGTINGRTHAFLLTPVK
ncbi:MAG: DUF3466 family protein [Coleofasciculus sp. Co-bin14]|nr:DUF3466 family protein [Coleofasciculus sp. Co-bin14]